MSEFNVSFGDRGVDLDSVVDLNLSLKVVHAVASLSAPCQTAFKMFLASTERRSALRGCSAVRQYFNEVLSH